MRGLRFWATISISIVVLFQSLLWFASLIEHRKAFRRIIGTRVITDQNSGILQNLHNKAVVSAASSARIELSAVPAWLLFRSIRSTVLQVESTLMADMEVFNLGRDTRVLDLSCNGSIFQIEDMCNISLLVHLRKEDPYSNLFHSFEAATRPKNLDSHLCILSVPEQDFILTQDRHLVSSSQNTSGLQQLRLSPWHDATVRVDCRGLLSSDTSRILIVLIADYSTIATVLSSWHYEAETNALSFPTHVLILGGKEALSSARSLVDGLIRNGSVCATIEPLNGVLDGLSSKQLVCPPAVDPASSQSMLKLILTFAPVESCPATADGIAATRRCQIAAALEVARGRAGSFDYLLVQGAGYATCPGATLRIVQNVLALRRAFSLVRCGRMASCFLIHAADAGFWATTLRQAPAAATADAVLFHHAHGLNAAARDRFADTGLLVTRSPLVHDAHAAGTAAAAASICTTQLAGEAEAEGGHEDEGYREDTGCRTPPPPTPQCSV